MEPRESRTRMQELGGLMEGKVDLDGAAEGAAAQAKQEALAKAREAALTAVEEAQRPLDEAKAAFEDAAGQLLAQGEALQARAAAFNPPSDQLDPLPPALLP